MLPSQALTKRHAEQQLMPPPPPPKRIKRPSTVLDEDIYTNALSQIIARDFFPGLLESQLKGEYLEAVESGDRAWMRAARGKLEGYLDGNGGDDTGGAGAGGGKPTRPRTSGDGYNAGETPTGSAWGGDTPMSVATATATPTPSNSASTAPKEIPDVSNMGLLSFQANYTSEDNESFNKLMDRQNTKHRDRYAWIWSGNKIPSARQIAHQTRENKRITASGAPEHNDGGNDGEEKALVKSDLDARPAKPDAWDARPENSLMFLPDSIEDLHETVQQRAEAESKMGPRRVLYQNTRLPAEGNGTDSGTENGNQPPPSPAISAIKDAIAGRPRPTDSGAASQTEFSGGETPRVNGYAFVDEDEPPSSSSTTETKEENDLRILGPADKTPNPFRIPQNRKREDLHHRMVNRMERTKRAERANVDTRSKTPVFASSPRLDLGLRSPATPGTPASGGGGGKMLTPAAQKLLKRVGSTPQRSGSESGSGLRNMWTPTKRK